ncbi:MAG: hypothetical protein JKY16_06055 [Lutibacter sp.]|nr:hypothetical protein [Lutibacter sp.]
MSQGKVASLTDKIYEYIIKNNFEFSTKKKSDIKLAEVPILTQFDILVKERLDMVKSPRNKKDLKRYRDILRAELSSKNQISANFIDSIFSTYNIRKAHVNVLVNYLYDKKFPIERSTLKNKRPDEKMHRPIKNRVAMFQLLKKNDPFEKYVYLPGKILILN